MNGLLINLEQIIKSKKGVKYSTLTKTNKVVDKIQDKLSSIQLTSIGIIIPRGKGVKLYKS